MMRYAASARSAIKEFTVIRVDEPARQHDHSVAPWFSVVSGYLRVKEFSRSKPHRLAVIAKRPLPSGRGA